MKCARYAGAALLATAAISVGEKPASIPTSWSLKTERISGHTDNQGGAELSQRLSQARAASVIAGLTSHGVAADRLTPKGYGPTRPVADNATENGRALNRRLEIAPAP